VVAASEAVAVAVFLAAFVGAIAEVEIGEADAAVPVVLCRNIFNTVWMNETFSHSIFGRG
jgi:F420-0:gamma-glutamyl ligase